MKAILKSKLTALIALLLVVVLIIFTFSIRPAWWAFFDIFFLFMMVFCHLLSLMIEKMSIPAAKKLETFAMVFGLLTLAAFIGEYIAYLVTCRP